VPETTGALGGRRVACSADGGDGLRYRHWGWQRLLVCEKRLRGRLGRTLVVSNVEDVQEMLGGERAAADCGGEKTWAAPTLRAKLAQEAFDARRFGEILSSSSSVLYLIAFICDVRWHYFLEADGVL
jgi:hypothetical protein